MGMEQVVLILTVVTAVIGGVAAATAIVTLSHMRRQDAILEAERERLDKVLDAERKRQDAVLADERKRQDEVLAGKRGAAAVLAANREADDLLRMEVEAITVLRGAPPQHTDTMRIREEENYTEASTILNAWVADEDSYLAVIYRSLITRYENTRVAITSKIFKDDNQNSLKAKVIAVGNRLELLIRELHERGIRDREFTP